MKKTIDIYTKPGCPYCAAAKEDMDKKGIPYSEHDVSDPAVKEEAISIAGEAKVPVIIEGDNVTVGFGGS